MKILAHNVRASLSPRRKSNKASSRSSMEDTSGYTSGLEAETGMPARHVYSAADHVFRNLSVFRSGTISISAAASVGELRITGTVFFNRHPKGARCTHQIFSAHGFFEARVQPQMFVTFATDATSTQREVIKLEYQVPPRVFVRRVRDQNSGFAFDVRIRKMW